MLEYFVDNSLFPETVAALKRESGLDAAEGKAGQGLLEKKWTSVVRLQKKVCSSLVVALAPAPE